MPFIIDGGVRLSESHAIMAYLVDKYAKNDSIYPKDVVTRAKINEMLYFDASALSPTAMSFLDPCFFGGHKNSKDEQEFRKNLACLNIRTENHTYLVGNSFTIADIAIASTLSQVTAIQYDISEFSNVEKYMKGITRGIPKFESITTPATARLSSFVKNNKT